MADYEPIPPDAPSLESLTLQVAASGPEREGKLDQGTFFHCVEEGAAKTLGILLRTRIVDVNAYNEEGLNALLLAVKGYDKSRSTDTLTILLDAGADVSKKAAEQAASATVNLTRMDTKHHKEETARVKIDRHTPLLLALELKSALYVKGWDYRHWDAALALLAAATIKQASDADVHAATQEQGQPLKASPENVQRGWAAVFESGAHELVTVRAEGRELSALKQILVCASKRWKREIEEQDQIARSSLGRGEPLIEISATSFSVIRHVLQFLYCGPKACEDEFYKTRGADVFLAAHKYQVLELRQLLERTLCITTENWIKVLSAATAADSSLLTLRVAQSMKHLLDKRLSFSQIRRPSFSFMELPPHQLFHKAESAGGAPESVRE